jgi:phage gpG-like protein
MLNIQLIGTFATVNPKAIEDSMPEVMDIMLKSVQMNLTMGGRPDAFNVKGHNTTPLVSSGKMYSGITGESDATSAMVYMDSTVVSEKGFFYPAALNYGAEIPEVSGKLMVFELDGKTIFTRHRAGFHLGPFPFMIFQDDDIDKITELIGESIFIEGEKIL